MLEVYLFGIVLCVMFLAALVAYLEGTEYIHWKVVIFSSIIWPITAIAMIYFMVRDYFDGEL